MQDDALSTLSKRESELQYLMTNQWTEPKASEGNSPDSANKVSISRPSPERILRLKLIHAEYRAERAEQEANELKLRHSPQRNNRHEDATRQHRKIQQVENESLLDRILQSKQEQLENSSPPCEARDPTSRRMPSPRSTSQAKLLIPMPTVKGTPAN